MEINKMRTWCIFTVALFFPGAVFSAQTPSSSDSQQTIIAGEFSSGKLDGWEEEEFDGRTKYELVNLEGKRALFASSKGAASGLFKKFRVNLEQTPYINWSWKVGNIMQGLDERTREGDDFPARIYVVHSGFFFWQTIAVNYVWSGAGRKEEAWPNPFTSNAYMLAVDSGEQGLNQWRSYKRNVREDFMRLHGEDITEIDVVAVMTDSDNAGQSADAWYGDIFFTGD